MPLTAGTRLGPYEILALLGAGGMGEVYRARDPRLARDVAIKVLPSGVATDADRLRRFEQEARAAAALNHSSILAVYDIGAHEGQPYIVAEALDDLTSPVTAMGTVAYMSPEQARGEAVDARSDLFSFGLVLYEMAAGHAAFGGATSAVIFDAILNRAPKPPLLQVNPTLPHEL